jgi:hypothetical protein
MIMAGSFHVYYDIQHDEFCELLCELLYFPKLNVWVSQLISRAKIQMFVCKYITNGHTFGRRAVLSKVLYINCY